MAEKKDGLTYVTKKNAAFPSGVAYPSMSDKFSNRDYTNTFADQAAEESGLDTVDDYPIFNDIEFQVDAEKTIKNNFLSQVGLRAAMKKTGGDLSKLLQNYLATDTKEDLNKLLQPRHMKPQYEGDNRTPDQRWQDEQDNRMGTLSATDTPSKTKEGPYDYNTTFVNDPSNPDFVLNPKIRIKLSELADSDSAIQTQWREVQDDPNATAIDQYGMSRLDANRNQMTNLEYMKSLIPENQTPMSQANVINHELNHFAIIELYNTGRLSKKILTLLRNNDGNEMAKIEHDIIDQMTRRDLPEDPTFKGKIKPPVVNETDDTKALDEAAKLWLKDNSPPVREYDSSGVLKAEEPKFKEEMYDGAIPAGLAKGGDTMPMEQQMQMFAIGGLDDDGLSRDPVSGNEIPPGSMANEVRDDVEARLSDGEYVVPANVVRFFGVKFFEDLRTQAMQGLGAMEANGRIGGEPVPSAMPMQDQMAEIQPDVSEEEMQMLQGLMNEGGYVSGYANGGDVPKDVDLENPTPFNPSPFANVGSSFFSPYNTNLTPDPNLPPTTMPVTPNPESGISFVTMVNPATGAIQVVQFMGGNPVDEAAYNQLLSSGFFIQGSPELAAYKQRIAEDNRDPKPDTTTRPHPSEATISQLGQLIAESSKGGKSLLEMIPGITGAVTGKLATDYRNDISRALAKTIADPNLSDAQRNAAQLLQNVWTNKDLSAKQRKDAIAKAGIFKQPSIKNALGKKAGKYMSENWFGLATKDQLEKQFGSKKTTTKTMTDAVNLTENKFKVDGDFYGSDDKNDGFVVTDPKTGKIKDYRYGVVEDPTDLSAFGGSGDDDNNNNNTSGGSNNNNNTSGGSNNNNNSNDDNDAGYEDGGDDSYSSDYEAQEDPDFGLMNKGGIVKKRKKKTKKY